jgi:hypothetical protein
MSSPVAPTPQQSFPQPHAVTTRSRAGYGLLIAAVLFAGFGGGLLAWHPWDKGPGAGADPARPALSPSCRLSKR